jgi:trk system potassium uptake protein
MHPFVIQMSAQSLARTSLNARQENIVVIGLGRFGSSVAENLVRLGHDVLGVDSDAALVQGLADKLTHVVQADASEAETLLRLGIGDYQRAVVGIGTHIESSLLTTLALSEIGVKDIWAKAINPNHGRILLRTGAHHIIYPEVEMGERVAHLVTGQLLEYLAFDQEFAVAKVRIPSAVARKPLDEASLRAKYGVTIVAIKPERGAFTHAVNVTHFTAGDVVIVSGTIGDVERFATL